MMEDLETTKALVAALEERMREARNPRSMKTSRLVEEIAAYAGGPAVLNGQIAQLRDALSDFDGAARDVILQLISTLEEVPMASKRCAEELDRRIPVPS